MRVLGKVGYRVVKGDRERKIERVKKKQLNRAEIKKAISRLKNGKSARIGGIPEEVWKYYIYGRR